MPTGPGDQNKTNEVALAKVSLTIVLIFILCHSVKWIPNIYELLRLSSQDKRQWPHWIESVTHVAHFLMSLNSSVNFYVYFVKHFRLSCKSKHSSGTIETPNGASMTRTYSTGYGKSQLIERTRSHPEVTATLMKTDDDYV